MPRKTRTLQVTPGAIVRLYAPEQVSACVAGWLDVFGRDVEAVNSEAYLWHIFSGGRYPSVRGVQALAEYGLQSAPEYVVFSNAGDIAFETDLLPQTCSLTDFYVCPRNLAWTMAFTHEDGWLGPYFARHAEFTERNAANMMGVKKVAEAEAARLKGWR